MASLSYNPKTGRATIQYVAADGRRPSIRLGRCTKRQAEAAQLHVEDLIACLTTGGSPKTATAEWLADVPRIIRKRLERAGLVGSRRRPETPMLGAWVAGYVEGRPDVKPATATVYGHTRRNLVEFFGESRRLDQITPADADAFRVHLKAKEKLADNTVRRRLGIAKQFLRAAVRKRLLVSNPFDGQPTQVRENQRRAYFVSREETQAVLEACPSAAWRLAFALCRFGGLRCASEVVRLKWADINWEKSRFTVHASKTEHHADAGIRVVPIFPELVPYLRDAFEAADPGAVYCCPQFANANQMYRKTFMAIIAQAGLTPWPKLFHNCRASCETELAEEYPVQVTAEWIGHMPTVAVKHYLQVTEEHFNRATAGSKKAVQKMVQSGAEPARMEPQDRPGNAKKAGFQGNSCNPVGDTGLEPVTSRV